MSKSKSGRAMLSWRSADLLMGAMAGGALALLAVRVLGSTEISSGDWLSFCGSLLGVGLAVLGAMRVEDYVRREEEKQNTRLLRGALVGLIDALKTVGDDALATQENLPEMRLTSRSLMQSLQEATAVVDYARANSKLGSAGQVLAVHRLEAELKRVGDLLRAEETWILQGEPSVYVVNIYLGKVEELAGALLPKLQIAITALDN